MLNNFNHLYSLSKTLRFELKPVGETADYIEDFKSEYLKTVVAQDEQRAEDYLAVKALIDDYHRAYIEQSLSNVDSETGELLIAPEDFEDAYSYFQAFKAPGADRKARDEWLAELDKLRKALVRLFTGQKELFGKGLITDELPEWLEQQGRWEENKELVGRFNKFTTYFTGFHENRKNMYTAEAIPTAIAHRLMNENLPRFFANCDNYKSLVAKYTDLELSLDEALLSKFGVSSAGDIFQPRFFINLFTQSSIEDFEEVLGGRVDEDRGKIQGLNELLNLYRQKNNLKAREAPGFTHLYKQILSDTESRSFVLEAFETDREMLDAVGSYLELKSEPLSKLSSVMSALPEVDAEKVYVKGNDLTRVSQGAFGTFALIPAALTHYAETVVFPLEPDKKATKKLLENRESYGKQELYSLKELEEALSAFNESLDDQDGFSEKLKKAGDHPLISYFATATKTAEAELEEAADALKPLLVLDQLNKKRIPPEGDGEEGSEGFEQVRRIHECLDAHMSLQQVLRPLHLVLGRKPIDVASKDLGFYARFDEAIEDYNAMTIALYNKTRNHLTKKSFSTDKVKINFESPTLLAGWDLNKETANKSIILRQNGKYYLGIMHPRHPKIFSKPPEAKVGDEAYEKVNYKLLTGANKMLPKVFFSKKGLETHNPSEQILALYKNGEHKKGDTFNIESCHKLIDFFKSRIPLYKRDPSDPYGWEIFDFKFSPTKTYKDLSGFYREVEEQGYKLWFTHVTKAYIDEQIEQGHLFLFEIYNKDFSPFSKGKPNLHTLYWKGLFEQNNLDDVVLKLNGEAEIFYRKHSIAANEQIVHSANKAIVNKNENNPKPESTFEYDLVKDRRYTKDKFFFHVPITLNHKAQKPVRFNDQVNRALQKADDVHVIGIDRGERHLLYYTVVNQKGEIIEQDTLNTISTDQDYVVDYHHKLDQQERTRDKARKAWTNIDNIKELKAGYLSHVVHKLAELIVKHNAVVCLEDLNFGFKRGRFKVEKQVYQKFERALIEKLNYLVFKDTTEGQPGHYLKAYQLTAPFESFKLLGKQSGILFYVGASYTSKIDPATGFINFLKPHYESLAKSKTFFESMDSICFNAKRGYFEFSFDYANFSVPQTLDDYQTAWTVCTHGETRYHNQRNDKGIWETKAVNVTEKLKVLLNEAGVSYQNGEELKDAIAAVKSSKFYRSLYFLLRLTLSLRHSVTGTEEDFILSPVADEGGNFYDSRNASDAEPKDADANGAYHIALKGLWNLEKIDQWDGESRLNLAMKNVEWFQFASEKPFKE